MRNVPPRLGVCASAGVASCGPATASATAPAPTLRRSRRETPGSDGVLLMVSSSRRQRAPSARGELTPQLIGTTGGDLTAQPLGPAALAAELGAPRPQTAGREMQRVLVGEAD